MIKKVESTPLTKLKPRRPIQTDHYGAELTINNGYYDDRGDKAHAIEHMGTTYHKVAGGLHRASFYEVHFYMECKTGRTIMVMNKEIYSVQPIKPYLYQFAYQAVIDMENKTVYMRG